MIEKYGLKKEEWHFYGQWEQPPLSADFWLRSHGEYWDKLKLPKVDRGILEIGGYYFVFQKDWDTVENFIKKICEEKNQEFLDNFTKVCEELFGGYKEIEKKLEKKEKSNKELFKLFVDYNRKIMPVWQSCCLLGDFTGELITEWAKKNKQDLNEIIETVPVKETIMLKQNKDILKIKKMMKEGKNIEKDIQEHLKEYAWIGTHHFWGESYNREKFMDDMKHLEEKDMSRKDIPESFEFLAQSSSEFGYSRQYSAEIFDILAYKSKQLLESIANDFGISYADVIWMHPAEIQRHLDEGSKPKNVVGRKKFCFFTLRGKTEFLYDEKEFEEFFNAFYEKSDTNIDEFKGVVASKGYAKGRAKVFLVPEDINKMEKGDVLVTTMTTPDFVPLMKKASAIITDIGGLLSHAAIISRELGKPCIIGTRFATKVIKDGDLVEVDANKGVVKILKKA